MKKDYSTPIQQIPDEGRSYYPRYSRKKHDYTKLFPQLKNATTRPQERKIMADTATARDNILELLE